VGTAGTGRVHPRWAAGTAGTGRQFFFSKPYPTRLIPVPVAGTRVPRVRVRGTRARVDGYGKFFFFLIFFSFAVFILQIFIFVVFFPAGSRVGVYGYGYHMLAK
jgi:hypothetical protein